MDQGSNASMLGSGARRASSIHPQARYNGRPKGYMVRSDGTRSSKPQARKPTSRITLRLPQAPSDSGKETSIYVLIERWVTSPAHVDRLVRKRDPQLRPRDRSLITH
jgi:hypothetical protein